MDLTDLTGPASVRQPWWELYSSVCVRQVREYFVEFSFTLLLSLPLGQGVVRLARHTELKFH